MCDFAPATSIGCQANVNNKGLGLTVASEVNVLKLLIVKKRAASACWVRVGGQNNKKAADRAAALLETGACY